MKEAKSENVTNSSNSSSASGGLIGDEPMGLDSLFGE